MGTFEQIQRKSNTSSTRAVPTSHRLRSSRQFAPASPPSSTQVSPGQHAQYQHGSRLRHSLADIPIFPPERENHTGLPDNLKAGIENLSGMSMDDVQVHYNSSKPAMLQALAYTQGTEIHVGPGQERHLAHEAWHVIQQKQGRVRPTLQVRSIPINHSPALEREANLMGTRALAAEPEKYRLNKATAPRSGITEHALPQYAPVQGVWILRKNGNVEWEDEDPPYTLKKGESFYNPPSFKQQPSVTVNKGKEAVDFDDQGMQKTRKLTNKPPSHKELQKKRERQGKELRERMKKSKPTKIDEFAEELGDLAEKMEDVVEDVLTKKHAKKVEKAYDAGDVSGSTFRNISKGLDEFTQSEASSAFIKGLRTARGNTPPPVRESVNRYGQQTLRLFSSNRAPTPTIVAPVSHKGSIIGQQHPTEKSQPKLQGGSSSHAYEDRYRVHAQNQTFEALSQDPDAPPNPILFGAMLAANTSTLSHMSAPLSANNLPLFNQPYHEQQRQEREMIKEQANLIAEQLDLSIAESQQDYDAPWLPHETPTSPRRMDEEETQASKKKKKKQKLTQ
jgi:hypothetical protein